jgi:hypothetical protein
MVTMLALGLGCALLAFAGCGALELDAGTVFAGSLRFSG